ncbi:hypothetical protein Tsubulata_012545 [Turnera subulata]|uniref:RING-type domain-containing protein n=1 Tax=Turnera subulata TaxID=218843 RepID=A0A9Q0GD51_9ROSI|nr:hypothetical protein Tsubulata_012545 [Turnera subulata]
MTSRHQQPQQLAKVDREKVAACMTCPLCNKLFRDATTISECLHTYDGLESCPVCDISLGCAPMEKLRADHSLDDLRAKIFPSQRQKSKKPGAVSLQSGVVSLQSGVVSLQSGVVPEVPSPGRRKEKSISSLVVSTPNVSEKPIVAGKRWKSIARKAPALRESFVSIEEPIKNVTDCLSSPETLVKIAESTRQNVSASESCKYSPSKDIMDFDKSCEAQAEVPKPLNLLVDGTSNTKSNKSNLGENIFQKKLTDPHENEAQVLKTMTKELVNESKVDGDDSDSIASLSGSVKRRRLQGSRQKGGVVTEGLNVRAQVVSDSNSKCDARFSPIWFSLIASDDQEGKAPLPQISSCYLRVRDGSVPISSIKKYIVQKLGLASDSEVEISLRGHPVLSTAQLQNVVEFWLKMSPVSERMQTTAGSSGKDFVMVLSYSRKAQPRQKA